MLQIRQANINDIDLIRELTAQIWPQTYIPIIGETQVTYMLGRFYTPDALEKQMNSGDTFVLCFDAGTPVAFASYGGIAPRTFKLHKLYIVPGRQGKGIGTYLLEHIMSMVKQADGLKLQLNVNRYNLSAKLFYEKMGFAIIRDEDLDIGGGYYMNDHVLEIPVG